MVLPEQYKRLGKKVRLKLESKEQIFFTALTQGFTLDPKVYTD